MKYRASTIAMAGTLLMAAPAMASAAGYIKFEGVDGEAATEVALDGWSFGACQSGTCSTVNSAVTDASLAKGGKGRASMQDMHLRATGSGSAGKVNIQDIPPPMKANSRLTASQNSQSLRSESHAAVGDLDGDGRADLAYAASVPEVSSFTLHYDKAIPMLMKVCSGKHIAKAELRAGGEVLEIRDATVTCSTGMATTVPKQTQGATFGERVNAKPGTAGSLQMTFTSGKIHTRTGHVTLMK